MKPVFTWKNQVIASSQMSLGNPDRPKYEDIYLRAYETPAALRAGLTRYFDFYNTRRRHTALDRRTPDAVYFEQVAVNTAA